MIPLGGPPFCPIPVPSVRSRKKALHELPLGVVGQMLSVLGMAVALPSIRRHLHPSIQAPVTPWRKGRAQPCSPNPSTETGKSLHHLLQTFSDPLLHHESQVPCMFLMCQEIVLFLEALVNKWTRSFPWAELLLRLVPSSGVLGCCPRHQCSFSALPPDCSPP